MLGPSHHRLLLEGPARPSGWVTPQEVRLRLTRTDEAADAFAYLHEVHHVSLNDTTAWGTLLHLVAAAPEAFNVHMADLVDACLVTHEAYASYAALSIVETRLGPQPGLLDTWPLYSRWSGLVADAVAPAASSQRRYLLAVALARVCMQCPVGEALTRTGPESFRLSVLRTLDRPDGRFRSLVVSNIEVFARAVAAANAAVPAADEVDAPGAAAAAIVSDDHDGLWLSWERTAYDVLARALKHQGATTVDYDGHQDFTEAMIQAVEDVVGPIPLRGHPRSTPAQDDLELASSVLVQTREDLVDVPYEARVLDVSIDDLPDLVAEYSRIGGVPVLVVSMLLPERLEAAYRWNATSGVPSHGTACGVRLIESDSCGESAIVWVPVRLDQLVELLDGWAQRGPAVALATASCLSDPDFAERGLDQLKTLMPTVIQVDVPPDRLMRSWTASGEPIQLANIRGQDTSRSWQALAFVAADDEILWLVVGAEATVGLYRQALETAQVQTLDLGNGWSSVLPIVLTAIVAVETTIDFMGVEGRT